MDNFDKKWMIVGAALLAAVSSLIIVQLEVGPMPSIFIPMPSHLYFFAVLLMYGVPVGLLLFIVMPSIYAIVFVTLRRSPYFGKVILIFAMLLGSLNFVYIYSNWEIWTRFQDVPHMVTVTIVNAIGVLGLISMVVIAIRKKSKTLLYSSNLLLFLLLSYCMFPHVGGVWVGG